MLPGSRSSVLAGVRPRLSIALATGGMRDTGKRPEKIRCISFTHCVSTDPIFSVDNDTVRIKYAGLPTSDIRLVRSEF